MRWNGGAEGVKDAPGYCPDNAVMKNFFGLLKSELLYLQKFQSTERFRLELLHYLELLQQPPHQGKAEGPAACNSQTTSPFGCLYIFCLQRLSNFLGPLHTWAAGWKSFIFLLPFWRDAAYSRCIRRAARLKSPPRPTRSEPRWARFYPYTPDIAPGQRC